MGIPQSSRVMVSILSHGDPVFLSWWVSPVLSTQFLDVAIEVPVLFFSVFDDFDLWASCSPSGF